MNAKQRRIFRRCLDRAYPPGTWVRDVNEQGMIHAWRVRPRGYFDQKEHTHLMIEKVRNPFGHISVHYNKVSYW